MPRRTDRSHTRTPEPPATCASDQPLELLTFSIGREEYGLPLQRVEEIAALDQVTRVATAPPFVLGLLSVHGAAVPVIDLAKKLDAHDGGGQRYVVILRVRLNGQRALVGLVVDHLGRLSRVNASAVQPPPQVDGIIGVEFLTGVYPSGQGFVLCVDVDHLLGAEEGGQVSELFAAGTRIEGTEALAEPLSFLSVCIAGEQCVLPLGSLFEIVRPDRISRVPGARPFVLGATNVRGSIVPVLDLGRRCGLDAASQTLARWLVLVEVEGLGTETPIGLAVEDVAGLVHVAPDRIDRTPPFGTRFPPAWVEGMVPSVDLFVPILDVVRALSPGSAAAAPGP